MTVVRRGGQRRRTPIINGTLEKEGSGKLLSVPRKTFLHVTRLHPDTTCSDVLDFVRVHFSEAECQKQTSRYPDFYASSKISINIDNIDKAMLPEIWPNGVRVSRFFQKRHRAAIST